MAVVTCRFCKSELIDSVVDLGESPLCNQYLSEHDLLKPQPVYPLKLWVCRECLLVQLDHDASLPELFKHYLYYASYSEPLVKHAHDFVDEITNLLELGKGSLVVEVGSNDGYLLQHFVRKGIPCLGVDPAENLAERARERGVRTRVAFFNHAVACSMRERLLRDPPSGSKAEARLPNLIIGNAVLARARDLLSFVAGIKVLLDARGTATFEFAYVRRLIEQGQFDTIYHEHFSYFSLSTIEKVFQKQNLVVFDAEEVPVQGGSMRIYVCHLEDQNRQPTSRLQRLRERELTDGFQRIETYTAFEQRVRETKSRLVALLHDIKARGGSIVGYGAPAKGTTLLSYCGIGRNVIDFTVDKSPYKQGKYMPGTKIPIYPPARLHAVKPEYVLILSWNMKDEIMEELRNTQDWGVKFIVPIPEPQVI